MTETKTDQVIIRPSNLEANLDGVTITRNDWEDTRLFLLQQADIRRHSIVFLIKELDGTEHGTFEINTAGMLFESTEKPSAIIVLPEWAIVIGGRNLIRFPTLNRLYEHVQRVANASGYSIPVTVSGLDPQHEEYKLFEPQTAHTGEFHTISVEEFAENLLSPRAAKKLVQEGEPLTEKIEVTPIEVEEPEALEPEPRPEPVEEEEDSTVPNGTVKASSVAADEDNAASSHRTSLASFLFSSSRTEETEDEGLDESQKRPLFSREAVLDIWDQHRTKILIAATALGLILLLGLGALVTQAMGLLGGSQSETMVEQSISDNSVDVPAGYSTTSAWSVPIPSDAKVQGTTAAAIIIDGRTLTLYNNKTGQKIREIVSDYPISTIDETTIDGEPAIIWLNEDKTRISAWHQGLGTDGNITTEKLPAKSQVIRNGQMLTITASGKVYTLTGDGLTEYTKPKDAELTPWSISEEGLLSIGYDVPLKVTNPSGETVRSIDLTMPEEDYSMQTWVAAGNGYAASIWSKDVNNTDADQPVKLVIHNLSDGSVSTVIDGTYSELAPSEKQMWKVGQGFTLASYGPYVFSLKDGTLVSQIDSSLTPVAPKGDFALGRSDAGNVYLFQSEGEGYSLSGKYLLSQVPGMVITQKGGAMVAYPSSLT